MALVSDGLFFIRAQEVNMAQWEVCLAQSPQEIIYAHTWYLDIVCGRWSAVVEIRNGHYVSLLPLPEKNKAGLRLIYPPFFTQQLGLFTTPSSRFTQLEDYLALIPRYYSQVGLQLNSSNCLAGRPSGPGWQVKQRQTYHLQLDQPYQKLYQAYSYNQKRNIKKGNAAYQVLPGQVTRLIALFQDYKGAAVPALKARHYAVLSRLYQELHRRGQGQVLELWAAGELLAAGLFLYSSRQVIYLFGASSARGRQQGAMAKLLDHVIRQQAGSGRILDFEGSDLPGLAKFYSNFGALPVPYLSLKRTLFSFLPWPSKRSLF